MVEGGVSRPAWWDRDKQKQNSRSAQQERKVAKRTGGRVQAGSGSSWRAPQDVKTSTHLISVKYTDRASYSIKADDWAALVDDAAHTGREPALIIEFPERGIRLLVVEDPSG